MNRWFARLACRVAGHDWSGWSVTAGVRSRYCRRHCGLEGSYEYQRT